MKQYFKALAEDTRTQLRPKLLTESANAGGKIDTPDYNRELIFVDRFFGLEFHRLFAQLLQVVLLDRPLILLLLFHLIAAPLDLLLRGAPLPCGR